MEIQDPGKNPPKFWGRKSKKVLQRLFGFLIEITFLEGRKVEPKFLKSFGKSFSKAYILKVYSLYTYFYFNLQCYAFISSTICFLNIFFFANICAQSFYSSSPMGEKELYTVGPHGLLSCFITNEIPGVFLFL